LILRYHNALIFFDVVEKISYQNI